MKKARNGFIKALPYLCLVGVIALGFMTIVGTGGGGGGGGNGENVVADYSGTYYVNLASQPRWMMYINHSGNHVTFTMDGVFLIEGEGTVSDNTMTLTAEINGTVNMFITFSEDGQSFSGTWDYTVNNGTITGTKSPWATYDVDINGIPQFVSTDVIELLKISEISKFRSGAGHDYSDDFESCRSMKHYFIPKNDVDKLSIMIFSPINGTVIGTTDEWTEESVWKGTMISIESEDYPAFHIIIFHIDLINTLNVGDKIIAGQVLGYPADYENVTISDTAVGVITPSGYKLVSYFEVITDSLFQSYQACGLSARDDVIISKEERDADPLTCVGEIFTDSGNLENWVILLTNDSGNVLSHFDNNSYLPIVENATWTYNYGSTVKVTNVNTTNNTFDVINVGISGSMAGIGGQDSIGNYISYDGFLSPEFLPIRGYFGFRPLLYEDSKITVGLNWQDSGNSNGYPYTNNLTITSTDTDIITPGGQVYNNCIVLQRDITYPNGYHWDPYLTNVIYYLKKGIGFVQEVRTWSDDSQEINYLISYSIP